MKIVDGRLRLSSSFEDRTLSLATQFLTLAILLLCVRIVILAT